MEENEMSAGGGKPKAYEPTGTYGEREVGGFKSKIHGLGAGNELILKGVTFQILEILSEGTGEAVIYKVMDSGGNLFAVKLYFEFNNPNDEPKEETLRRIAEIKDPDILRLYDFGVGQHKYQGKFCYELSDFAAGGDLFAVKDFKWKYNADFITSNIIPEIYKGLRKLHEARIVHCDLKPHNIFYKDDLQTDLIIGDYGSAKWFEIDTYAEMRKSSTVKGTETYLAPEQPRGIISEKNDYYSFGMILLHLLYPEQIAHDDNYKEIDKAKFRLIVLRQYGNDDIILFDPQFERINNLIKGLTLLDHGRRFGHKEMEQWFAGEEVTIRYANEVMASPIPIRDKRTIKNTAELINFIRTDKQWQTILLEDNVTSMKFWNWLDQVHGSDDRKEIERLVSLYLTRVDSPISPAVRQSHDISYTRVAILNFLDPGQDISLGARSFNFQKAENLEKEVAGFFLDLDQLWKTNPVDFTRFKIFQLECALSNLLQEEDHRDVELTLRKIYAPLNIEGRENIKDLVITQKLLAQSELEIGTELLDIFYNFNPERVFKDLSGQPKKTLEDIGFFYVEHQDLFNDPLLRLEKDRFLDQLDRPELAGLNYADFIFEIFKKESISRVEIKQFSFDKERNYSVAYVYFRSLTQFLAARKIHRDFNSDADPGLVFRHKKGIFRSFGSVFRKFIEDISEKHHLPALPEPDLWLLKKNFVFRAQKRFLALYYKQFLAFTLLVTVGIAGYVVISGRTHYDANAQAASQASTPSINLPCYRVSGKSANLYSSASARSGVLTTLLRGTIIQLLQKSNRRWYYVGYNGMLGYVNTRLIVLYGSGVNSRPRGGNRTVRRTPKPAVTIAPEVSAATGTGTAATAVPANSQPVNPPPAQNARQLQWINCNVCNGNGYTTSVSRCTACGGSGYFRCVTCGGSGYIRCSHCGGSGIINGWNGGQSPCPFCNGQGQYKCPECHGEGHKMCRTCNGNGQLTVKTTCTKCNGTGKIQVQI